MKVLAAPLNYSHKQEGQLLGLKAAFGEANVVDFDYWGMHESKKHSNDDINAALIDLARRVQPDWIWLQIQGTQVIQPDALRLIKNEFPRCVITHWMGDIRERVPESLAAICRVTDATLISSIGQIPMFREAGAPRVEYVQIGLDYLEDVVGEPAWTPPFDIPDVVFIGNYYANVFEAGTRERVAAIRYLQEHKIPIGVVGAGWPSDINVVGRCHVKQQHHVYKRAKVALAINHFNNIERYYSDRLLIALASGTPVVARHVPGLEKEFELYHTLTQECVSFANHETMIESITRLLDNETMRREIGARGRRAVIQRHTWEDRFRALAPKIEAWRA